MKKENIKTQVYAEFFGLCTQAISVKNKIERAAEMLRDIGVADPMEYAELDELTEIIDALLEKADKISISFTKEEKH